MHSLGFTFAALAVLCSLGSSGAPQPPQNPAAPSAAQDKLCAKCKSTGRLDNTPKDAGVAAMEAKVDFCSWRIKNDTIGHGAPFIPCPNCLAPSKAAAVKVEFDKIAQANDAWLAERMKIDAVVKPRDGLVHIATKHFDLVYGLPQIVLADKRSFDIHAGAHLYAERLEDFYTWFEALLHYTDDEVRVKRHSVFLLNDLRTAQAAAQKYTNLFSDRACRAVGDPSIVVTWRDRNVFGKSDEAFHRHVVHHVSHNLQGIFYKRLWLVEKAGWLDEGIANVCEMKRFKICGNACTQESDDNGYNDLDWEPLVKKRVLLGKTLPLAQLLGKKTDELSPDERMFAWSHVDFLFAQKPDKVREIVKAVKDEKEARDAIRENFGFTIAAMEEPWAEWVKATYRDKPIPGGG